MACDFDITKENIYDYIIEDTPGADESIKALSGICSQRADSQWIIAHGELPDNRQLNISSLGYFTIPKLYGLMEGDADISALDEIGALRVLGQDNLKAEGINVLIGYVDTGIDYLNDVFKDRLGNTRIQAIWDQTDKMGADVNKATRAGLLSKCDLMTNMVFEFTDTQGVMGMHYARHDGEDEEVAVALNEQYMPRFAGDELPKSLVASAVALADKFDTLTGIFGIGQAPKGSADPFALRRAALGALRIIVEKNLPLDLEDLVKKSAALFGDKLTNQNVVTDVVDFMLGRFRAWYQDEGIAVDVIQAVLARRPTRPADFDARVRAVSHFRTLDSAEALAAANKRVSNILAKADAAIGEINLTACVEPAEKALAEEVLALRTEVQPLIAKGDYTAVLDKLANLRAPVDNFFDNVMVNAEDPALRQNRLAILNTLQGLFLQVADISVLQ